MTKSELRAYAMRVSQASRTELIVIMYEVAIKYIDDAVAALNNDDKEGYRQNLKKSKAFVNELASVLDMKYEVSLNLLSLYTFMNKAMVRADITLKTDELIRVRGMLDKLRISFVHVSAADDSAPMMKNVQQVYAGLTYSKNSLNESYGDPADMQRGYKV